MSKNVTKYTQFVNKDSLLKCGCLLFSFFSLFFKYIFLYIMSICFCFRGGGGAFFAFLLLLLLLLSLSLSLTHTHTFCQFQNPTALLWVNTELWKLKISFLVYLSSFLVALKFVSAHRTFCVVDVQSYNILYHWAQIWNNLEYSNTKTNQKNNNSTIINRYKVVVF